MRVSRRSLIVTALLSAPAAGLTLPALAQPATAPSGATPLATAWPHTIDVNGAPVTVYEPQAIDWPNRATLRARAAIAITPPGSAHPILGTIELAGSTEVDTANNVVYFERPTLLSSSFPALDTSHAYQLQTRIAAFLTTMPVKIIPLDTILLSLNEAPVTAAPVDNTPPTIYYSAQPASLLVFDGEPVMAPLASTGLSYAVNTNWDVIQDPFTGGAWYLLNNGSWLVAQAYTGPYEPAGPLPPAFSRIPDDADFGAIRKAVPGKPLPPGTVPVVFVSTKPAEIIVTAGAPAYQPVPGTALNAVTNTGSVLFLYKPTSTFYYLVSGRWFSAASLYGPWTFATPNLPADFAQLSPNGSYGNLLAAVPGTAAAQAAVLKAQIPTQATLSRKAATVTVTYAGAPNFAPIPGTTMRYATNTPFQVIDVNGLFYCCYQGAWFVAHAPTGPWALATSVPSVIYTIPPSSPVYNVTYVQVYGSTPATITYGFTSGYVLGFVTAGVLAYGTGYYYPPYVVPGTGAGLLPLPLLVRRERALQYGDRRVGEHRHGLRPLWQCSDGRRCLQPEQRRLYARRRCLRPLWRRQRVVALQSLHRHLLSWQRELEQRQRHGPCLCLQPLHGPLGQHDAERQPVRPLGVEHRQRSERHGQYGERQQRERLGRRLQREQRRARGGGAWE